MIGYLVLMLVLAGLVCLGSYWISWENQDAKTRPRFATQFWSDCATLFRRASPRFGSHFIRSGCERKFASPALSQWRRKPARSGSLTSRVTALPLGRVHPTLPTPPCEGGETSSPPRPVITFPLTRESEGSGVADM